jgi:single-stranded-DNA-specific exonuclease
MGTPVLERVLLTRGLSEAVDTDPQDHDPHLLTDMDRAVELVEQAIRDRAQIAIYGDYDADGVTASALLVRALRAAGLDPFAYIPNRDSEGYGLNSQALEELSARGADLVITVDCGTTAVEVVAGRPAGMGLVITDHHLPFVDPGTGEVRLAPADALINPQRPGDRYPFRGLAGVGVAHKLVEALEGRGLLPSGTAVAGLPLVALGTVADLMPLTDENRQLVRRGLASWAEAAPLGLLALARSASLEGPPTSSDLGFSIGPRINAAGRMEDASLALQCCLADTKAEAEAAASLLEQLNRDRRRSLAEAMELARPMVQGLPDDTGAIVLGDGSFPAGVVGLVAGRLAEEFQRPAFIYSMAGEEWKGSARGVAGLNVVEALAAAGPALLRWGGHRGAGGFSLPGGPEHAAAFRDLIDGWVRRQLQGVIPCRVFAVDAEVELAECNLRLADQLSQLGPFGIGNPRVTLSARGCRVVRSEPFGGKGDHCRVVLDDGTGQLEAIGFNRPGLSRHLPPGRLVDALFELDASRWRGRERLRLLLRDLRPARD